MTDETMPGPKWTGTFLTGLAETGKVRPAAKIAGIAAGTAYAQRRTNLLFADAWEAALATRAPDTPRSDNPNDSPQTRSSGWRHRFFEALFETSNVTASAKHANVPTRTVYKVRCEDADFAAKWLVALHAGYDSLEMELLAYLRDPQPGRKMDVASALRLLAAHRETVARERRLSEDDDEQAVFDSIDAFIEDMRQRRAANTAILIEADANDVED
ncbi:hypothetical protein [Altererythrobacter sp. Root672]|uniref:hypothetical protein n=1 Tax=Altererythrobacter sp. Root672 TaxID=1736584 RepID=UPI0006F6D4C1|nr:hypothetical protein [Altererythrobacter sp. Root672]KRA81418.1 hypothetical protein ASD76_12765 [Altererythrobacter sp. Root672]